MDHESARRFAGHWLEAWNSHDLDAVLSHFSDDVVFSSPMAVQVCEGSDGVVRGKAALRDYWAEALRRTPELHFEIESLYVGVHTLVINYRNQAGGLVNEVLVFDGAMVAEGHGTYLAPWRWPGVGPGWDRVGTGLGPGWTGWTGLPIRVTGSGPGCPDSGSERPGLARP